MKRLNFLSIYNLLFHPLKNKLVQYQNNTYQIINVYREWKNGWYISIELTSPEVEKYFIKIPFLNINSDDPEIQETIKIIQEKVKLINGSSCSESTAKT